MNDEKVFQLLMETNPVPDPDGLDSPIALAQLEQRSPTMATTERISTEPAGSKPARDPGRRRRLLIGAVTAMLALIVGLGTWAIFDSGGEAAGGEAIIEAYTAAYNAGDIDAVMALFTEESVIRGHPFSLLQPVEGLAAIEAIQLEDRASAASVDPYTISNVEVSGNTVTWDHVWTASDGSRSCVDGQSAVVEDGKILIWAFARPLPCL